MSPRFLPRLLHSLYAPIARLRWSSGAAIRLISPMIVFAPHQDDEVLGCGGTIAAMRAQGGDVKIVFISDGASPNPFIAPNELQSIRKSEALASATELGVLADDVVFLGYEDGQIASHCDDATTKILALLERVRPKTVFLPYRHDVHSDHEATHQIIFSALKRCTFTSVVYEYPIWFLCHWPLLGKPTGEMYRRGATYALRASWRLWSDFRWRNDVRYFLRKKRAALECHRSQTTALVADPRWSTLHDVAAGEWLPLFFRDHEIFHRAELGTRGKD